MVKYQVNGDLSTFEECNTFFKDITELINSHDKIFLDLSLTKHFSSTAAGRIVTVQRKLQETQKKIFVTNIHKSVKNILKEIGLVPELKNFHFEKF